MLKNLFSKKITSVISFVPVCEIKKNARVIKGIPTAKNNEIRLLTSMFKIPF